MKVLRKLPGAAGLIAVMLALTATNGGGVAAHGAKPAVPAGMVSMSLHSQAGYRFGPGLPVCVFASQIHPNGGSTADVVRARLQGYLITQ